MPQIIGYARTSTSDQLAGLDAQKRDLKAAGCSRIFDEQLSSVAERGELAAALEAVGAGDALMVTKPDRLARSTLDLLTISKQLDAKGAGLIVLSMGGERLDTRNPTSKLMLTILAGVATWEREIMLERQREGIAKARADGKYKGRAPTVTKNSADVLALTESGMLQPEIARRCNMSERSVRRIVAAQAGVAR